MFHWNIGLHFMVLTVPTIAQKCASLYFTMNQTATWKAVHINNKGCKISLGNGGDEEETVADAGCHMLTRHQQPTTIKSKEQCLQARDYKQDSTADTGHNSMLNNEGNG